MGNRISNLYARVEENCRWEKIKKGQCCNCCSSNGERDDLEVSMARAHISNNFENISMPYIDEIGN